MVNTSKEGFSQMIIGDSSIKLLLKYNILTFYLCLGQQPCSSLLPSRLAAQKTIRKKWCF